MSSSTVIPRVDSGKLALIQHINAALPGYAAALDLSPADLAELDRATAWFKFGLRGKGVRALFFVIHAQYDIQASRQAKEGHESECQPFRKFDSVLLIATTSFRRTQKKKCLMTTLIGMM